MAAPIPPSGGASASSIARWRLGINPWGRKIIITTRASPNSSTRYSVMLVAWPPRMVLSQRVSVSPAAASRRYSGRNATANAPTTTPGIDPIPPSTTADSRITDRKNGKLSGLMKLTRLA